MVALLLLSLPRFVVSAGQVEQADPADLTNRITEYLRVDQEAERTTLLLEIERKSGGSIEFVVRTLREVLIPAKPPTDASFTIATKSAGLVSVRWWKSIDPDSTSAPALILCLPDADEIRNHDLVYNRVLSLGPAFCHDCVIATLDNGWDETFRQHPSAAEDLRSILRELRRNLPIDSGRIYLYGRGAGGEAAWMAAMFNPDLFAGVVTVASVPRLPFSRQLLPILMPNLSAARILSIRSTADSALLLDAQLEAIVGNASRLGISIRGAITQLPFSTPSPWQGEGRGEGRRLADAADEASLESALAWLRGGVRPPPGRPVSHWFRYLVQGDAGWIRAGKLYGDVWTEDQFSIASAPQTDRNEFITDVLKDQLFHFSGQVDGQTLTVTTHRIAEIELRFYEGMLDFTKPVTVLLNGRKRHDALIRPSLTALLESARRDGNPQRLVLATLTFSIAPDSP